MRLYRQEESAVPCLIDHLNLLLQTWRTDHPPKRGSALLRKRPMVHKGFWLSWSSKGVRDRVFDTIAQIMGSQGKLQTAWRSS